jgi:hypothetical protein
MSAASSNPLACREDALNALGEIRACHDEMRAFLTETFDRLDDVVSKLRHPQNPPEVAAPRRAAPKEVAPEYAELPADQDMMQDQMEYLTRLVTDLANTVKVRESVPAGKNGAKH